MATIKQPVSANPMITIKISVGEDIKKLKLPLTDLTADVLPAKLMTALNLPTDKEIFFERFSDSAGSFVTLDSNNPAVYKTLVRAAKAKLKLRLRAIIQDSTPAPKKNIGAGIFDFKETYTPTQYSHVRGSGNPPFEYTRLPQAPIMPQASASTTPAAPLSAQPDTAPKQTPADPYTEALRKRRALVDQQRAMLLEQQRRQKEMVEKSIRATASVIASTISKPAAPQPAAPAMPTLPTMSTLPSFHASHSQPPSFTGSATRTIPLTPPRAADARQVPQWLLDSMATADARGRASKAQPIPSPSSVPTKATAAEVKTAIVETKPTWSVYCNICDTTLVNEHYHCSICDGGDYDLCQSCVNSGKSCLGNHHWLVKRFVKDGVIVSSTTERVAPKAKATITTKPSPISVSTTLPIRILSNDKAVKTISGDVKPAKVAPVEVKPAITIPGAFEDDAKTLTEEEPLTRTCNSCVAVMQEKHFVHCDDCEDFDLCLLCHVRNKHGHHPGHTFVPVADVDKLGPHTTAMLAPGRQVSHAALCDGCDKDIKGVRHKCFDCPDFDYCSQCYKNVATLHPQHRFAPVYEPIGTVNKAAVTHHGVFCDGPACSSSPRQCYITGDRFKCVICQDTDFCANCEASPHNKHNKSHPLLKIKSPIRGLQISTADHGPHGQVVTGLGDKVTCKGKAAAGPQCGAAKKLSQTIIAGPAQAPVVQRTATLPTYESLVKTVAHIEPEMVTAAKIQHKRESDAKSAAGVASNLQAVFVSDTIPDGITVRGKTRFTQVWTLRNPGPLSWPAGCSVRLTGGDNMLSVSSDAFSPASAMATATESNVVGREVKPGEEVAFKVVLRAPEREGRAISYWRLKTASGEAFGHRLWCDINVRACVEPPVVPTMSGPNPQQLLAYRQQSFAEWKAGIKSAVPERKSVINPIIDDMKKRLDALRADMIPLTDSSEPHSMVFPTLEKESPASSVAALLPKTTEGESVETDKPKVATVEDEATGEKSSAVLASPAQEESSDDQNEVFEDISSEIEVLSASEHDSEDDGFLTDEEYDILDASDEETIASGI